MESRLLFTPLTVEAKTGWGVGAVCYSPNCRTVQIVTGNNLDRLYLTSVDKFVTGNLGTPTVQIVAKSHFSFFFHFVLTPPRYHEDVIFSLQFVCVCVSVCLSVNKIPAKRMHGFERGFC